jgi:hypothetical protein
MTDHPLAEARVNRYGEPPTMPDIDPDAPGAPRERPAWWPRWWELEDLEREAGS